MGTEWRPVVDRSHRRLLDNLQRDKDWKDKASECADAIDSILVKHDHRGADSIEELRQMEDYNENGYTRANDAYNLLEIRDNFDLNNTKELIERLEEHEDTGPGERPEKPDSNTSLYPRSRAFRTRMGVGNRSIHYWGGFEDPDRYRDGDDLAVRPESS